jgi:hypothetical protein
MQSTEIIWPLLLQVALTFALLLRMAFSRIRAIQEKQTTIPDIALGQRAWPDKAQQAANAYHNQFEMPVLFYVLVALSLITSMVDYPLVLLAWIFVLSRLWHAWIHSTHNVVRRRFNAFAVGVISLAAMWLYFAGRLMMAA